MSGNSFVSENRPRIFDCRANVKVFRLRVIGRNKIEPGRIFIINTRWIHEAAGTRRLKRLRQLANLKCTQIIGQRHEVVLLQKVDHLGFAALVRLEKRCLIGRDARASRRIGIG